MQERLNQIIEQRGLTATKFAALIGVNASTISHILAGRNKPGFDIINNIAKTFPDIDLGWLITGNGSMYTSSSKKENNHFSEEPTLFDLDEPKKQTDTPIQEKEKKTEIEIILIMVSFKFCVWSFFFIPWKMKTTGYSWNILPCFIIQLAINVN